MKLFIYDHCPYCVKARIIFGLKEIPFTLITLLNDDEKTPIDMIGAKMVPILEKEDGSYLPESLDIISYIDSTYKEQLLDYNTTNNNLKSWLSRTAPLIYKLAMPRWSQAPLEEFSTNSARQYFIDKKEAYIGNFAEHLHNSASYIANIESELKILEQIIYSEKTVNQKLGIDDIHLFAALRSLSIVKNIKHPTKIINYANNLATSSEINLHNDIAI